MDLITEALAALLTGLAAVLAAIGALAAVRYREARLGLVATALGLLAVVGIFAFLHEVSPRYGEPFEVAPIPLGLAVVATGLLYVAMIRGRSPPSSGR